MTAEALLFYVTPPCLLSQISYFIIGHVVIVGRLVQIWFDVGPSSLASADVLVDLSGYPCLEAIISGHQCPT